MAQQNLIADPVRGGAATRPAALSPVDEPAFVAPPKRRNPFLTRGNLLMAVLFAGGIAGVYALSLRMGPARAMASQMQAHSRVDAALNALNVLDAKGSVEMHKRNSARAIVNEFYMAAKQRQVQAEALQGNPFIRQDPRKAQAEAPGAPVEPETKPAEDMAASLQAVKTLKLQSVLVGKETIAVISNNLLTVGQTIKGWKVTRIDAREVELTWKEQTYILRMP